jgi:hypothetical protein
MRDGSWRRWRRILWRNPADDVNDELDHHVEERIRDYIARGMDPESARGAARERLGDLDRVRDECTRMLTGERRARDRRILLNVSLLDVKLGLRMLAKYPGLSLVAVLGMAVAIAIGAGAFAIIDAMLDPTLPFDEGDRIVTIQNNRADEPGNPERRALHDFVMWREELESVQDLGAFRTGSRNLIADNGTALVRVAEMSAAGFRITRVLPVEGRYFAEDDEREGAPAVLVIAHEEWQRRFDGDPDIIGRTVRLGATPHTIIGVMPEGFRFPFAHRYWVPLRLDPSDYARGSGPSIDMFGRLADGVSLRRAQAELTAIGQRMSAAYPETHRYRRPRVMHYTHAAFDVDSPQVALAFRALQLAIGMLLVVVALNVAILVYARTTTRAGEIAVRSALGASRRRVVAQLFVEALVLTGAASVVGLAIAAAALATLDGLLRRFVDDLPFWVDIGLSVGSVVSWASPLSALRSSACSPRSGPRAGTCKPGSSTFQRAARRCSSAGSGPRSSSHRSASRWPCCRRPRSGPAQCWQSAPRTPATRPRSSCARASRWTVMGRRRTRRSSRIARPICTGVSTPSRAWTRASRFVFLVWRSHPRASRWRASHSRRACS